MATQQTKRESVIQTSYNSERGVLTFRCAPLNETFDVVMAELAPTIVELALAHGIKQKGIDAAAITRNPETGKSATPADKWHAVTTVLTRITTTDQWNAPREGGDGGASLLSRALVRFHDGKKSRAEVDAWLATKSDAEKKALRANPRVAAIIAAIQAESVDDSINSDELLEESAQ